MPGELILIVEDEPNIVQLARLYLERDGFRVESVGEGFTALDALKRLKPALMVLDLMLPGLDGLEICRRIRAENFPISIIMLTARDEDVDKILGLEMGADDYLTKPFNPRELVARVKAILRRDERDAVVDQILHTGDITVDVPRREFTVAGQFVELRKQEFELLKVFVEHAGLVLEREKLLELAWGHEYYGQTRTVDVHVGHLRKKLAVSNVKIETITGIGYKLVM